MAACEKIRRKSRKVCIGDMRDRIELQIRSITAPSSGSVNYTESFTSFETVWAMVETQDGVKIFDGVNLTGSATHFFYIRFLTGVTFENWVKFKDQEFDILDVQNLEERDEFYLLRCSLRGNDDKPINFSR